MPDDDGDTSIRIKVSTWRELKDLKEHPNESFDDVIQELLETYRQVQDAADEQESADEEESPDLELPETDFEGEFDLEFDDFVVEAKSMEDADKLELAQEFIDSGYGKSEAFVKQLFDLEDEEYDELEAEAEGNRQAVAAK